MDKLGVSIEEILRVRPPPGTSWTRAGSGREAARVARRCQPIRAGCSCGPINHSKVTFLESKGSSGRVRQKSRHDREVTRVSEPVRAPRQRVGDASVTRRCAPCSGSFGAGVRVLRTLWCRDEPVSPRSWIQMGEPGGTA